MSGEENVTQEWFTSSHQQSSSLFSVSFHNLLSTPTELVQLIKIWQLKASVLTFAMCIDDAYDRYQKRNINDTLKKGVPSHRI
jgi:hypothetical protein